MPGALFDDKSSRPEKSRHSEALDAFGLHPRPGGIVPLSDLRQELGATADESPAQLRERLAELVRRAECRYAADYDWSLLKRALIMPKEKELFFEPAFELKHSDDRRRLKEMRVLCQSLIPIDQELAAKISFMETCRKRGACLLEGEEPTYGRCLTQLTAFKAGSSAYLTKEELSLVNDFWRFKEEFEAFTPPSRRHEPGEKLGNSGFVWRRFPEVWGRLDLVWLPILEGSRYHSTPIFDNRDRRKYIEALLEAERSPRNPLRRIQRREILESALQYYNGALSAQRAADFLAPLYRRYPPPLPL